jgi:uncharacterized protein DUF4337
VAEVELPNPEELHERAEDRFGRRVALVTALYAVILALSSLGGNNAMKEMLLAQQLSSDQWAFYQAKVIRESLSRSQRLRLELDLVERGPGLRGDVRDRMQALLDRFAEDEKRYNAEKKDIEKAAKALEHERDVNRAKDPYFDYAEVLLQIAIVLSSVSILSKSRPTFWISIALALLGGLLAINGFALYARIPFLEPGAH